MPLPDTDPSAHSPSYVYYRAEDDIQIIGAYAEKCSFYSGMFPIQVWAVGTPLPEPYTGTEPVQIGETVDEQDHEAEQERADGWLLP